MEVTEAKAWVYAALHANSSLVALVGDRIWQDEAPQNPTHPYILYGTFTRPFNVLGADGKRLMTNAPLEVRVIVKGQPSAAQKQAADLADSVLTNVRSAVSNGHTISAVQERQIDEPMYDAANTRYHHMGGVYRLFVFKS